MARATAAANHQDGGREGEPILRRRRRCRGRPGGDAARRPRGSSRRRGEVRVRVDLGDVGDEAVAAPGDGFDKSRALRRIAQRLADLVDRLVETMIEIDEGIRGPESAPDSSRVTKSPGRSISRART